MLTKIYPFGLPIALSLVGYNSLLTGLFFLFKRRDKIGFHYFVFALSVFAWGVGVSFMLNSDLPASIAEAWGRFSQACALFIPATWLHFVLVYTEQKSWLKRIVNGLSYVAAILLLPFAASRWFIPDFRQIISVKFYPIPGPLYVIFTVLFCLTVTYAFWILYHSWAGIKSGEKRSDYKLLFLAQLYGFTTGSLSFLPVYGIPLPQYNLLVMPLWQFLLAYAMVRYRLFDLEEVAQAAQKDKLAAIGLLSASINHEIRNPLFVIKGHAEILLESMEKGAYRDLPGLEREKRVEQALKKTLEQASRIVEITKRLTDFSKSDLGGGIAEQVNLNEVVDNVLSFVGYGLKTDNIRVEKSLPSDFTLQANQKELEQIFLNLVINASQAMDKKAGQITIEAQEKNGKVEIRIKDAGPGIPPDKIAHIFEPFFTTKESGTGLGLYVTKQLVERNRGRISVDSKPGEGTTFILEFRGR